MVQYVNCFFSLIRQLPVSLPVNWVPWLSLGVVVIKSKAILPFRQQGGN
jgi:hypothetical protein